LAETLAETMAVTSAARLVASTGNLSVGTMVMWMAMQLVALWAAY
jgi:hypothetical protein